MKLYLSSYHLGEQSDRLVKLVGENKKAAIVANARDIWFPANIDRTEHLSSEYKDLENLGFEVGELDLREYFGEREKLISRLSEYGLLWVVGGNSFVLLRAMKYSGFNIAVPQMLNEGALVYAGYSAGVVVATPTLNGIELMDDQYTVTDGYDDEIVWDGMNLVNYSIVPHYQSGHPESDNAEKCAKYFSENDLPYKTLRDGDVIIVE
jgi:dipeptidase E